MNSSAQWWIVVAMTLLALAIIARTHSWRVSSVLGPGRLPPGQPLAPLVLATAVGFFAWFATQVVYVVATSIGDSSLAAEPELSPRDLAVLATVPAVIATAAFLLVLRVWNSGWLNRLGLSPSLFGRGATAAIIAILAVYPLVLWSLVGLEAIYDLVQFEHPQEHEILKSLASDSSVIVQVMLIVAAVILAPVYEELLFRGGVQTLLRGSLAADGSPLRTWAAIAITSLLFAIIHAPWTAPAIFVLSLCLGYLYERTGNLWAAILMHALFNASNTICYLVAGPP